MAKLTLNTIGSRYGSIDALNANFDAIEAAMENTLSRDGTSPNTLLSNLDVNDKRVLNVANGINNKDAVNLQQLNNAIQAASGDLVATLKERATATAGQTTFTLSSFSYSPGSNNLSVYIDGVKQYAAESYTETNSTTVTFTSPLNVGAELLFLVNENLTTLDEIPSSIVTYTPAGSGATTTTVQAKLRETVSVKDFGAVGDGVTDDTAAIQAALDSGANRVHAPQGTYKTTSVLNRPNQVKLYGDGPSISIISAAHNGIIIDTSPVTLSGDSYNSLEDIGFTNAATFNSSIGIKLTNLNQPSIKRVRVTGGPVIGMQLVFVLNGEFEELSVTDCSDTGIYLYSSGYATGTNRNVFQCINSNYCATSIRIDTTGGLSNQFNDVAVEASTGEPIQIVSGEQIVFDQLYLEGNADSVAITGGDTITLRDCLNVSAIPLIKVSGFAGTNVVVENFKDLNAGGLGPATVPMFNQGYTRFPATAKLSTNAYTLDDYREGTWTPTDASGAGLSLTVTAATYTKIGRLVHASLNITFPSTADGSTLILGGLPFRSISTGAGTIAYCNQGAAITLATSPASDVIITAYFAATGVNLANSDMSTKILRAVVVYETDQ